MLALAAWQFSIAAGLAGAALVAGDSFSDSGPLAASLEVCLEAVCAEVAESEGHCGDVRVE